MSDVQNFGKLICLVLKISYARAGQRNESVIQVVVAELAF